MKFSLIAAALVALALTACGKPHQANPESIEGYGVRTEEGTTVAEERAREGENSGVADPSTFDVKSSSQDHQTDAELAGGSSEAAVEEDEYSGKAVLPGHNLDGNGNPIVDGKDPTKLMH
jgi:hypothetical protein|tara:strand:- start:152 stop:511 length:360 start_codon:yes stop_codon:yes gene_type:complete